MASALAGVWVSYGLSVVIMVIRLILGRKCRVKWDVGDSLTVAAIVISTARIALAHVTILWQTNRFSEEFRHTHQFSALEIYHREMGGKFTLATRAMYMTILWLQRYVLLAFYERMLQGIHWGKQVLLIYKGTFLLTFSISMVVTFVECRPIDKFWRVFPDPGNCPKAIINVILVGSFGFLTDLMLIILPIPILKQVRLDVRKKVQLGLLFGTGILIILITAARIPFSLKVPNSQTLRFIWTEAECLASAFAANAPLLYSFRQRLKRRTEVAIVNSDLSPRRVRVLDDLESTAQQPSGVHELKEMGGNQTSATSNDPGGGIFVERQ